MYMTIDQGTLSQYIGMNDETGEFQWIKQTMENELFGDLLENDIETIKKNKEMTEKYTEDVKYFGNYIEDGKTLQKLQYIMSGDIYKEIFNESSELMPAPTNDQEAMATEMLKNFANMEMGDLTYIIYIDKATGEMVKMEMDLGDLIGSMIPAFAEILGEEIPPEAIEMLKSIKASFVMDIANINSATDFEIPEAALNAQDVQEMIKELEPVEKAI